MIVKSISHKRSSFRYLLNYMFKEQEKNAPENLERFVVTHNIKSDGRDVEGMTQEYLENESQRLLRRKDSNMLYHEVISYHPDSYKYLDTEKLKATVERYISLRGKDAIYVATPHFDAPGKNVHIHLAISGVRLDGRAFRVSKDTYNSVRKELQQWQIEKYPELSDSVVAYGKGERNRISDREFQQIKREGTSARDDLRDKVGHLLSISSSFSEFKTLLKEEGIKTYDRRGEVTGVLTDGGQKHRLSRLVEIQKLQELKEQTGKEQAMIREQIKSFEAIRNPQSKVQTQDRDLLKIKNEEEVRDMDSNEDDKHIDTNDEPDQQERDDEPDIEDADIEEPEMDVPD